MDNLVSPFNMLAMKTYVERLCEYMMLVDAGVEESLYADRVKVLEETIVTMSKIPGFDKYRDELVKRLQSV